MTDLRTVVAGLPDSGVFGPIAAPLCQEDLAELAGTSRATVNRVLREQQERGTVELGRSKIVVCDQDALRPRSPL